MDPIMKYPISKVVPQRELRCVKETDSIMDAIACLEELGINAVPVVTSNERFVGVLSKTDIVSTRFVELLKERPIEKIRVSEVMKQVTPLTVKHSQTVASIVALMYNKGIHQVFITNEWNKIYNMISTTDMIKILFIENMQTCKDASGDDVERQFFQSVRDSHERFMQQIKWVSS